MGGAGIPGPNRISLVGSARPPRLALQPGLSSAFFRLLQTFLAAPSTGLWAGCGGAGGGAPPPGVSPPPQAGDHAVKTVLTALIS